MHGRLLAALAVFCFSLSPYSAHAVTSAWTTPAGVLFGAASSWTNGVNGSDLSRRGD